MLLPCGPGRTHSFLFGSGQMMYLIREGFPQEWGLRWLRVGELMSILA